MLVYGDPVRIERPAVVLERVGALWREGAAGGLAGHARLVAALIEAGGLAQGLADHGFEARGRIDDLDAGDEARMRLCLALAEAVRRSWEGGFRARVVPDEAALAGALEAGAPEAIRVKVPEGYAFYGLYPEAVLAAARRLGAGGRTRVVGIRSIGTGLAAIAAAALGDPRPVTARPVGDPFGREVRLSPALARHLTEAIDRVVVVDEGPGLSGSSFGCVADALEALGVPRERIAFLPSHGGDLGPQASEPHRARWAGARRPVVSLDELILDAPEPARRLETWVAGLVGPLDGPLEDVSGGAWRARVHGSDKAAWPASAAHQERRKFLARAGGRAYLVKFAGIGPFGARMAERAEALARAGFTPPVAGFRHGFLVQDWLEDARPWQPGTLPLDALVAFLARYLAFRARAFPAGPEEGASGAALVEMTRRNATLGLGDVEGEAVARLAGPLAGLDAGLRRHATDNRLHAPEWCVGWDGRLWKTDAVDHHATHDLVGCQDLAWDVVGAQVELGLDPKAVEALCAGIEAEGGPPVDRARLEALRPAYLAFHLGRAAMAADALAGWPQEAQRLRAEAERYRSALALTVAGRRP